MRDVSFSFKKGKILGFTALMDAGRTGVERAIFGADEFDSGEILVNGQPVRGYFLSLKIWVEFMSRVSHVPFTSPRIVLHQRIYQRIRPT